ncbi:GlcG/HbpS family heme-binding protein [Lachnospiraceae bacterium LCP25S3_G4]
MNESNITAVVETVIQKYVKETITMNLKLAKALIEQIEKKAESMKIPVVVAVSDASAKPVAIHCMDGAFMGSYDVALNKTFTSVAFQMSTEKLGRLSQPGESLYGIQFTNGGKVVIFGGGEPLKMGNTMIGALGVSGGTAEQDTELAAYGKKILKEVISCL